MTIPFDHPSIHPSETTVNSESLLSNCICYANSMASVATESIAQAILPIIMSTSQFNEIWDFEWKTAFDYITDGLTTQDLYPHH